MLALDHTVDQNPVLKKAGVVDAGGKGFLRHSAQGMLDKPARQRPSSAEDDAARLKRKRPTLRHFRLRGYLLRLRHGLHRAQSREDITSLEPAARISRQHRRQSRHRRGRRGVQGPRTHEHSGRRAERGPEVRHAGAGRRSRTCAPQARRSGRRPHRPESTDDLDAVEEELEGQSAKHGSSRRSLRSSYGMRRRVRG